MNGLVSIVIPVYNRKDMIASAVQSVLDQTYRPIEVILIDDGSTDGTLAELNRLAAEHPDLIRVAPRENGGPGLARESGRLLAAGEFIQYLDSDDLLLPRKLEVQVAALRNHPECGIAYCRSSVIDQEGHTLREPSKWTGQKIDTLFPGLLIDRWWHTHTPLYRKSLCDQIGPWPKNRPEDWDYDARAGATGTRLVFCDEVLSSQRHHAGACVSNSSYERYLPQEAWFLPRLHDCAVQAGVSHHAPEMRHFIRWAFTLARRIGALGMDDVAEEMLALAVRAGQGETVEMRCVRIASKWFGWRRTGRLCQSVDRWRAGERSLSHVR
jgi:glycosyltransferase involved in cell wall biosynthesis